MGITDDVGAAFTGTQQQTDPATATNAWDSWLDRPGNRQAMLQMGLQMMQPVGIGQTPFGHVGQAIGAGGEALTRADEIDRRDKLADTKIGQTDAELRIAKQNADSNTVRANAAATRAARDPSGTGLTAAFRARADRQDVAAYEKRLDADAKALHKQANDLLADKADPNVVKYKGKSQPEIREMLRADRPAPKAKTVAADDNTDDDEDTTATAPYPGAQQAPDGNWYVKDPKQPGKYLKVVK